MKLQLRLPQQSMRQLRLPQYHHLLLEKKLPQLFLIHHR
jgi:hypothetical protein